MADVRGRLLVVDDIEENRDLLQRRLMRRGYEVEVADGGQAALAVVAETPIDLILLDVMMPGMSGLETLERLRCIGDRAMLPVIMVSAKNESGDIVQALEMGANDYISKPIDFSVALARIGTHLELKRADNALRNSEARSRFLANMSHELLTPLNAINGFSDLMFEETLGPLGNAEYRDYAGHIKEAGEHLRLLISDILDVTRSESVGIELDETAVDVSELVRSCVALVQNRADAAGVQIENDAGEERLPMLFADEMRVKQIVLNLLSNAVKYTPANGTVSVRVWHQADEGFVLQVSDTGIGMADIQKALAPFEQAESSLNRTYDGLGLGLPLTKLLAERHGGSFDLKSEVGGGTVATVKLPGSRAIRPAA